MQALQELLFKDVIRAALQVRGSLVALCSTYYIYTCDFWRDCKIPMFRMRKYFSLLRVWMRKCEVILCVHEWMSVMFSISGISIKLWCTEQDSESCGRNTNPAWNENNAHKWVSPGKEVLDLWFTNNTCKKEVMCGKMAALVQQGGGLKSTVQKWTCC